MKKFYLIILLFFFGGIISLYSQSLAGKKICINPGHGGNDSNDRFIPDTGFWESEGNLAKGLHLKAILEGLGATVIMSRVENKSSDDLPLPQIVELANSNNVDYFHSIHSNAHNAATNYTLILFQGRTSAPTYPGSGTMANFMVDQIYRAHRTTNKIIAGDFDFYGTGQPYLGVFKGLTMPGTLSEGSFHDYIPESFRLKNSSYLKHEAWAIARSFLQYFNGGEFQSGVVAGIVRDELEQVPSTYKPISSTNDKYKPLNKITVRLEPGGKIYNGDEFNNGFYLFDELTPGTYKLYFDYTNMKTDSATVVIKKNESVFADKLMILNPILDPPVITSFSPTDNSVETSNVTSVVVEFSIRMNPTETQNAISITPSVDGSFKWENEFKKATFTPTKGYTPGAKYTVTVSKNAVTHFGVKLQQEKSFNFTTRSQLKLLSVYPTNNSKNISTTVLITLKFEKGIDGSSLGGRISLADKNDNAISVSVKKLGSTDGIIEFEPKIPLENNTFYKLNVKEGIKDIEYVTFPNSTVIEFKTDSNYTYTGSVIEGFESGSVWQSPLQSSNTTGIVNSQTLFEISSSRKISGDNGGRLQYGFSGSSGQIDLALINPISLGQSSNSEFGIWVFGDNSKNILEYRFFRNNLNIEKVTIDTINWTGWKLKRIALNSIAGSGSIHFKSINVIQTGAGANSGVLHFDDCLSNIITGIDEVGNYIPSEFKLHQNYPNPFNPTTAISFSIAAASGNNGIQTTLKVYDLLGKEVAILVDEEKTPGFYQINFDGNKLSSGVYIYKLTSGNFTDSKKFILLK